MSGKKLEYVKEAASHVLRLLTEMDRVSVITYDDQVKVLASSQAVTAQVRDDLIRRIRGIRPGGMTNLSDGWFTGCDQVADYMTRDYLNRALLLTDGLANRGLTDHERLVYEAKELRRRGVTTTTFGVGHDFNQFLLQGIADAGGGHFYFIDKPNQIPSYFAGELGELLTTVAREITLDVKLPAGLTANLLNDTPYERTGQNLRIFLGDAYAGETRTLALKLNVPVYAMGRDIPLLFTLRYEEAQQRRPITVKGQPICFTATEVHTSETQTIDETVLREATRLEVEQAKMTALQQEYRGDVATATGTLRQTGELLQNTLPPAMAAAFVGELDDMEEEMESGLTDVLRKKKHYAAYQKQRSRGDYKKK